MTTWHWTATGIIAATHIVGGITAFGSTLLSVAVLVAMDGTDRLHQYVGVLALCGLIQAGLIAATKLRSIRWRPLLLILLTMGIAMPLGRLVADVAAAWVVHFVIGVALIGGAIAAAGMREDHGWVLPLALRLPVLGLAGLIHGGFASGGALLVPYMRLTHREKQAFRGTLSGAWIGLNGLLLLLAWLSTERSADRAPLRIDFTLIAAAAALAATLVGQSLARKLNQCVFGWIVTVLMILTGLIHLWLPYS